MVDPKDPVPPVIATVAPFIASAILNFPPALVSTAAFAATPSSNSATPNRDGWVGLRGAPKMRQRADSGVRFLVTPRTRIVAWGFQWTRAAGGESWASVPRSEAGQ